LPFPRPIDSTLHGVVDYQAGAFLTTLYPRLTGVEGTAAAKQLRGFGAAHAGYSMLTKYPLGLVKLIPFKAHLALDAAGALALGALPFVTGQWKKGTRQWLPQVGFAVFELASLAMTDPTGDGDFHGDVEAVQHANELDPHSRIYNGGPAVQPATAS
jgi:hypothetical protein